ncbi:MAG: DUF1501 domain-containing protein [Bryobacterales bacterium]|nr:DUF1501 domain-containing protein [Bryobacterales bacterium]
MNATRRSFLKRCAGGVWAAALADRLAAEGMMPRQPHFPAKAKNVIFMFMEGGPSQLDLFDPKPGLAKYAGQPLPKEFIKFYESKLAFAQPDAGVLPSPRTFKPWGQCGTEMADWISHTAARADDICLIRSMHTDAFNHHPGQLLLFSGSMQFGRPSVGAWVTYGLGSESQDLPGFVVLASGRGTSGGVTNWTNGFLPSLYQGTVFRSSGDPILYLSNPGKLSRETQRVTLDALKDMNEQHMEDTGELDIASRISSYELAFRMQMAAPGLLDFSKETAATREAYGIDDKTTKPFGTNCLLARRMVERGVRFVLLADASWDDHTELNKKLKENCDRTDKPVGALLKDLKERGLLDSTLVVWCGEFGRTPMVEHRLGRDPEKGGRDHHPFAYSLWMAGGGIKGGQVVGKTDEFCMRAVEDPIHVNDLQATILHCLGFEHTRLTYRHLGRDFRLTDIHGHVVKKLLA